MEITIIYPYRNRELTRIKNSLESLKQQNNTSFNVLFVDYGSDISIAKETKKLVESYDFAVYEYSWHLHQPWSRAKAINIGIQKTTTEFCFIADIDMIFAPNFIEKLHQLKAANKAIYFKVGFLSEEETNQNKPFNKYTVSFESKENASGLSLFPVDKLKTLHGFDEFLQYWGAEDNDIHQRLTTLGVQSEFYNKEVLMLHQWHKIYRAGADDKITKDLRIKYIVKVNQLKYDFNKNNNIIVANYKKWGKQLSESEYKQLLEPTIELTRNTSKVAIDFIKQELKLYSGTIIEYTIVEQKVAMKDKLKAILKSKPIQESYSLKEVNDILLKEILVHYKNHLFSFKINDDLNKIVLTIKL